MVFVDHTQGADYVCYAYKGVLNEALLEDAGVADFDGYGRDAHVHRCPAERAPWTSVVDDDLRILEDCHAPCTQVKHIGADIKRIDSAFRGGM